MLHHPVKNERQALTEEETAAACDLALTAVNTESIYRRAQAVMRNLAGIEKAKGRPALEVPTGLQAHTVSPHWVGLAKIARQDYARQFPRDERTGLLFGEIVLREAARMIADQLAEEYGEIRAAVFADA